MSKKVLFLFFYSILTSILFCSCNGLNVKPNYEKGFIKFFGSSSNPSFASQVQVTKDGGYVLIGTSDNDMYIAKTDSKGNKIWEKKYGGIGADSGRAIKEMPDGSLMALGTYYSPTISVSGMFFLKLNPTGDSIWSKVYFNKGLIKRNSSGSDFVYDDNLNRFCLVGAVSNNISINSYKGALLNLVNSDGSITNLIGNQTELYINGLNTLANSVILESDLYSLGGVSGNNSDAGIQMVRFNKNLVESGRTEQNNLNMQESINSTQILKSVENSYVVTGSSINNGLLKGYLLQFDFPNNNIKYQLLGNGKSSSGQSVVALSDGSGYVVVGSVISSTNGSSDIYITKIKKDGTVVWEKNYGGIKQDVGKYVKETSDGGFIILATMTLEPNSEVIALFKVDENGDIKN